MSLSFIKIFLEKENQRLVVVECDFEGHNKSRGMQLTLSFAALVEGLGVKMEGGSFEGYEERKELLFFSLGVGGKGEDKSGNPYVSI